MADFSFQISQKIVLSSYGVLRIGEFVKDWGQKFMVVMDPVLTQMDTGAKITKPLTDRKLDYFTFSDLDGPADTKVLDSALVLARQAHVDGIVAAGGSKAINLGRAIACFYNEKRDTYTALEKDDIKVPPLPLICVPTTIRDRFVFSPVVPLVDARSSALCFVHVQRGLGDAVLVDPNLTLSLSSNQSSSLTLEAIALALEAYISPKANFFSDMAAEKSLELLGVAESGTESLDVTTPKEELLCQGGLMASLAASTSSLGITSLLSVCINARFGTPSALVSSVMLPYIVDDAAKFRLDRLATVSHILNITEKDATNEKAAADLSEFVRKEIARANLPARMKDLNVTIEQLTLAAEDAGKTDFINTLPRSTTSDDLFSLIKSAY